MSLRSNTYPGQCPACFNTVGARMGVLVQDSAGRNRVYCSTHVPDLTAPRETPEQQAADEALLRSLLDAPPAPHQTLALTPDELRPLLERVAADATAGIADAVDALVKDAVSRATARHVSITIPDRPMVEIQQSHQMLPTVLQALAAGASPFLVGPAGSGKTTLASQCATALGLPFYMAARVTSEFKLVGFTTATGQVVRTQFREAYEHGGVFLFDEVDAGEADAMTAFNAALANGLGEFPDGLVKRHEDFYAIAAGNTYGRGADRQYVGRNQLDAATLDRFQVFDVDYDEELERQLAGDAAWTKYVQAVRRAVEHEKVRHIVSPRASITGARMLAAGMARAVVENATVWKGLPQDARQRVEYRMASQGERV